MTDRAVPQGAARRQWLRRLAQRRRDKIAFVLSGGGPLGALQVGGLRALLEKGIEPDLVVGTSVGALNCTFLAFDPSLKGALRLEEMWRRLGDQDLFPGGKRVSWARFLVRGNRVFENSGLRRMVETRLGRASFEDAQVPLYVVATDLESGEEKVFGSGELIEPLLASTAMPGVFPPVLVGDRYYIDGGVSNNVPIVPAIDAGATTVYVLDTTAHVNQRRPLIRPIDYLLHSFSMARAKRLEVERPYLEARVNLVTLPTPILDFHVPFTSMAHTEALIDLSYEAASAFLSGEGSPERRDVSS